MKRLLCTLTLALFCLLLAPQQAQAQYYCSYGVAYGASWTWQSGSTVYFYSSTELDYCAGLYYDPATWGRYSEGNWATESVRMLGEGYTEGYADWIPAVIEASYAYPYHNQYYNTDTRHYVLEYYQQYYCFYSCGYYWYDPWGWGFAEGGSYGGPSFYGYGGAGYWSVRRRRLGDTWHTIQYVSSQCQAGNQFAENGTSCPNPTPTPTPTPNPQPTPQASVTAVGFKGDYTITEWKTKRPFDPDDATPLWRKGEGKKRPVAYKRGTKPVLFATVTVTSGQSSNAAIRFKKGSAVIGTKTGISLSPGENVITDIAATADLESEPRVKRSSYSFDWQLSYDGGQTWVNAGESGSHEFHWTFDQPLQNPFSDYFGTPYPELYDLALDHATGEMDDGSTDLAKIIEKINKEVANDIQYKPSRRTLPGNPVDVFETGRQYQCADNALLLRGLLRSIGIDAFVKYYYGGEPLAFRSHWYKYPGQPPSTDPENPDGPNGENVTLRARRRPLGVPNNEGREYVEENPHFTFHATTHNSTTGKSYDPSYGIESEVSLIEAYDAAGNRKRDAAANTQRVVADDLNGLDNRVNTAKNCGHSTAAPLNVGTFVGQSVPASMVAGEVYSVSVTLRNNGEATWSDAGLYRLGSQNAPDNTTWSVNRVAVPADTAEGADVTFSFYVTAPATAGYYNFQWQMLQEVDGAAEWFGDATPNLVVEVTSPFYGCYDPWGEQQCYNYGGWWDYSTCSCYGGWGGWYPTY